jgi:hypothetical protein
MGDTFVRLAQDADGTMHEVGAALTHEQIVIGRLDRIIRLLEGHTAITVTVNGHVDPKAVADQVRDALKRIRVL